MTTDALCDSKSSGFGKSAPAFFTLPLFVKTAIKTFNKYKNRGQLFQWTICSVALVTVQIAIYAATLPA